MRPGERVAWMDSLVHVQRQGTVLDRAPHDRGSYYGEPASGIWLWVIPDESMPHDGDFAVRVRHYSKGRRIGQTHDAPVRRGHIYYDGRGQRSLEAHRAAMPSVTVTPDGHALYLAS